jgi:nicotinamidase-related amidase
MGRFLIRGEHGHGLIDLLAARDGEPVIDKSTYGAFCGTELEAVLRRHGIRRLAICGVTADVCVHTTLREATDRGFECDYVRDAISTFDPELRRSCERMVEQEGGVWGHLTTVGELELAWRGRSPGE